MIRNASEIKPCGLLGTMLAQDRMKVEKRVDFDPPPAPQRDPFGRFFGTFSSLGRSWDFKMVVFG